MTECRGVFQYKNPRWRHVLNVRIPSGTDFYSVVETT